MNRPPSMTGKRLILIALGAVVGAIACATVARLLHIERPGSLVMGMAGGVVGAFTARALLRME